MPLALHHIVIATRFDKRASVFHGTVTVAAIRLWLRSCSPAPDQTPPKGLSIT